MKAFNRIFAVVIFVIIAVFVSADVILLKENKESGRPYLVEVSRLVKVIKNGDTPDISECEFITAITEQNDDFYNSDSDYVIREINGKLYRFDYKRNENSERTNLLLTVNIILLIMAVLIIGVMVYIRVKILSPFEKLTDVPYELSKGNLITPVKETKNKFFGKE